MIRFIDLGKQIAVDEDDSKWPRQFAFYNTVNDRFMTISDIQVFDSLAELIAALKDDGYDAEFCIRIFRLLPEWVRTVPAPRNNTQIFGFKG
jgi:hypothetical protein